MNRTVEWLNLNNYRKYPLVDDANYTLRETKSVTFADDVLLDCKALSYSLRNYRLILTGFEIITSRNIFRLCIDLYDVDTAVPESIAIDVPGNAAFPFTAVQSSEQYRLSITFGEGVARLMTWSDGLYTFVYGPEILPALLSSQYRYRVNRIQGNTGPEIAGVVFFEEGNNISIKVDPVNSVIYISALPGAGKGVSCDVLDGARRPGTVIKKVNDLAISPDGNINLIAGEGFEIKPATDSNTLVIRAVLNSGQAECNG